MEQKVEMHIAGEDRSECESQSQACFAPVLRVRVTLPMPRSHWMGVCVSEQNREKATVKNREE